MEIPKDAEVIDYQTSFIWFDTDGIMYSKPKPGSVQPQLSREEATAQMERFREIIGNQKRCMVLETNNNSKPPKKEDRDFIADQLNQITKAMAIVTSSPFSRMVANLFFGLKPPPYPVKFFTDDKEAAKWVKQFL